MNIRSVACGPMACPWPAARMTQPLSVSGPRPSLTACGAWPAAHGWHVALWASLASGVGHVAHGRIKRLGRPLSCLTRLCHLPGHVLCEPEVQHIDCPGVFHLLELEASSRLAERLWCGFSTADLSTRANTKRADQIGEPGLQALWGLGRA